MTDPQPNPSSEPLRPVLLAGATAAPHATAPTMQPAPRYDDQNRRLCTAHSKRTRELCNSPAMSGQNVCRMHGGSTNASRRKARLSLLQLVDPAIATLAREMTSATKSSDRQAAANSILDRAGWARTTRIETPDAREQLVDLLVTLAEENDQAETPEQGALES